MVIVDAIKSASTEHAVFFLVTAYVESLQRFHSGTEIPEFIVRLPLRGQADLRERLSLLERNEHAAATDLAVTEASLVFNSALERLRAAHESRESR